LFSLSVSGYLFGGFILAVAMTAPVFDFAGDVGRLFDPVGDAFRAGQPIYAGGHTADPFFYAPPWALAFATISWLPVVAQYALVIALNIAALRYLAGSWLRVGLIAWLPLVPLTLNTGQINLITAAAIYGGARGSTLLPALVGIAKLSPFISIQPRNWLRAAAIVGLTVVVTLPWASLWIAWIQQIAAYAGQSLGPQVPIPFIVRLPIAIGFLALRRPWATAVAATVAIPSFYWESFVIFLAPLAVWVRARDERRVSRDAESSNA
jgi:hypothetical protein